MKHKIKYVVIIATLISLAFTSTSVVAYWSTVVNTENVVVEVAEHQANLQILDLNGEFHGWLVPKGYDFILGEVTEVEFRYEVSLDKELIRTMNLIVEKMEVTIGGLTTYAHLVEVTIGDEQDLKVFDIYNDIVMIVIRVRLQEPIDLDEANERSLDLSSVNVEDSQVAYEAIKGQEIRIELGFRVEPKAID